MRCSAARVPCSTIVMVLLWAVEVHRWSRCTTSSRCGWPLGVCPDGFLQFGQLRLQGRSNATPIWSSEICNECLIDMLEIHALVQTTEG